MNWLLPAFPGKYVVELDGKRKVQWTMTDKPQLEIRHDYGGNRSLQTTEPGEAKVRRIWKNETDTDSIHFTGEITFKGGELQTGFRAF